MRLRAPLAILLPILLLVPACDDPSPIFGGGWQPPDGSTQGSLGEQAFLPDDGEWILEGAPLLEEMQPNGPGAHRSTPIALRFSESMAFNTLDGSLVVRPVSGGFPVIATVSRVGDGRLVLLLPQIALDAEVTYAVSIAVDQTITDLTGETYKGPAELGQFTTAASNPAEPSVLMSFPPTGVAGQSAIGEITTVFDRPMNSASFTDISFSVTVDGVPPAFDPAPSALDISGGLFPLSDSRVWRWISLNTAGDREPLGDSASVELALSTGGNSLLDATGGILPTTLITFDTASIGPPTGATIESAPDDAIGIANLTAGSGTELSIQANFTGGLAGDRVGLFVFGTDVGETANTVAVARSVTLAADGDSAIFSLDDLDLIEGASPLAARFADGPVAFVFQITRGSLVTPVRSLDVDTSAGGIQDPTLDTLAPELVFLEHEDGLSSTLFSELRGLSIAGRASEVIRAAEVVTLLGDNGVGGAPPAVLGSRADGSFLTAPVPLGMLGLGDMPLGYTLTIYDAALNPLVIPKAGFFEQRGGVGPIALGTGGTVLVQVYDAETLLPVPSALAFTHADDGATYPLIASGTTNTLGGVGLVSSAGNPTILTVEAPGYDIFSLVGVEAARISIPLQPTVATAGTVSGALTSGSDLAALTLSAMSHLYGDSRRDSQAEALFLGGACTSNPFGGGALDCPLGPEPIRAHRSGTLGLLGGNFLLPEVSFTPVSALQAFHLELPLLAVDDTEDQNVDLVVSLLAEPGGDLAELSMEPASPTMNAAGIVGVDLGSLDGNLVTQGDPRIELEALIDGLPGATSVGIGLSYDLGGDTWNVRTAAPGAALPGGRLDGVLDTDLFLVAELRDSFGATSKRRPRVSALSALPTPDQLDMLDAPSVTSPTPGSSTGAADFTIAFDNTITDAVAQPGLYRVRVLDSAGRGWSLFVRDPADGAVPEVRLVDIGSSGGTALSSGALGVTVEAISWPSFDLGDFLWSDLEREYDSFARGASIGLTQP